jgi:Cu/Ag efflux pump CusA
LRQVQTAIAESNTNVGGDFVMQGEVALNVRGVGLFGGGEDPVQRVLALKDPVQAAARLRAEEQRRLREIRSLVVATVNAVPVRLEDVVEGGRLAPGEAIGLKGVVVGHWPRQGRAGLALPGKPDENDCTLGVVLLRPGEDRQAALDAVKAKVAELNETPGRLLPGVRLEPLWERGSEAEDLLVLHAGFRVDVTPQKVSEKLREARGLLLRHPEVRAVLSEAGPDETGTNPAGVESAQVLVLLHPVKDQPAVRQELMDDLREELSHSLAGIDWDFLPDGMDDFQAVFVSRPGAGLLKISGPDLEVLERLAAKAQSELQKLEGVMAVHIRHVVGKRHLEFRVDPNKCARWGVSVADVNNLIALAAGGRRATGMIEGEKIFDITLLWPSGKRRNEESILEIPLDVSNNAVPPGEVPAIGPAPPVVAAPRLLLRDLVSPGGADGHPDPEGAFVRPGASAIWREQGKRLIAVRFDIRGRKEADVMAEAKEVLAPLFAAPYRAEWSVGGR